MQEQLSLDLGPANPNSLEYFVPHTGVVDAVGVLDQTLENFRTDPAAFRMIYIYGPRGSGKTHLLQAYIQSAIESDIPEDHLCGVDISSRENEGSWVSGFVSEYDRLKREGGLMIVTARVSPKSASQNPHIQSRLLAGAVVELHYPREEELRPLLHSLLERKNLKLSEYSLEYLLRRLPLNPLSFADFFAKIDRLSLAQDRPAGLGMVRDVVKILTEGV